MPPTALTSTSHLKHIRHLSNSLSFLSRRADVNAITPLASVFALVLREPGSIRQRDLTSLISREPQLDDVLAPLSSSAIEKRQQPAVLAIPTTYAGLNAGPAPGVLVGIVLGSIAGFLLIFFIVLLAARAYGGRVVEKETIIRHSHNHRDRRSRSRSSRSMSEAPRRRTETVMVEERIRRDNRRPPPEEEVIVEEQEDDVVEVIEEHSPERRPARRESKRTSGYRTVDPAEFGGGDAPRRKVSRR